MCAATSLRRGPENSYSVFVIIHIDLPKSQKLNENNNKCCDMDGVTLF